MVKTSDLVHLINNHLWLNQKDVQNRLKAEMLISLMSLKSSPEGCYGTPLLSYTAKIFAFHDNLLRYVVCHYFIRV